MGIAKVLLFISLVAVVLLAVYLNEPLPPNTANPIKYKIVAAGLKIILNEAFLESWITGVDFRLIQQRNVKYMFLASSVADPQVKVTEELFNGVPVYIYQSHSKNTNRPGLMYFHGGGFRFGHPAGQTSFYYKWVRQLDAVVVSVDYRLAPQYKAPTALEDCSRATQYFINNADKYGVNPHLIGAAGDSAGGNLATSVSMWLRDSAQVQLAFQILIYPVTQVINLNTPSYVTNTKSAIRALNMDTLASFIGSYYGGVSPRLFDDIAQNKHVTKETFEKYQKYINIGDLPQRSIPPGYQNFYPKEVNKALADAMYEDITNPYNCPLMADDLSNMPPAFVLTVENDPIRDDGIWYAKRLERAGNEVVHENSLDGYHGMIGMQEEPLLFDAAVKSTQSMIDFAKDIIKNIEENTLTKTAKKQKVTNEPNQGKVKGEENKNPAQTMPKDGTAQAKERVIKKKEGKQIKKDKASPSSGKPDTGKARKEATKGKKLN